MNKILRVLKYLPIRIKYKLLNYKIGSHFVIGKSVNIAREGFSAGNHVYIGQYSYIGPYTTLGNFCMLSDNVNIIGFDHDYEKVCVPIILAGRPQNEPKTILEDDVWIGHGVSIMRGVTIGEGSIIGANSVVTKDIPSYSVFAGIPAKFIKYRFTSKEDALEHSKCLKKYRKTKNF